SKRRRASRSRSSSAGMPCSTRAAARVGARATRTALDTLSALPPHARVEPRERHLAGPGLDVVHARAPLIVEDAFARGALWRLDAIALVRDGIAVVVDEANRDPRGARALGLGGWGLLQALFRAEHPEALHVRVDQELTFEYGLLYD